SHWAVHERDNRALAIGPGIPLSDERPLLPLFQMQCPRIWRIAEIDPEALPLDAEAFHPQCRELSQFTGGRERAQPLVEFSFAGEETHGFVCGRLHDAGHD